MKHDIKISESEWDIMQVLWSNSPLTANKMVESVSNSRAWKDKTIKTLINRLLKKGAIRFEKKGREYHYYPVISEKECKMAESRSFIRRVYSGAVKPFLASLVESDEITLEDIEELKQMIKSKKEK